ncbi:MAG: hypothetical protein ACOC22_03835 [bacterium]
MVKKGDYFLYFNPNKKISNLIVSIVELLTLSGISQFSHSGIIIDDDGTTFEAKHRIMKLNIYEDYINKMEDGYKIMIVRNKEMNDSLFNQGWNAIKEYEGKLYPYHRLVFFLFYPLPKVMHYVDWGVCSELTSKFYYSCNLLDFWSGVTPGDLEMIGKYWKNWNIIYEKGV